MYYCISWWHCRSCFQLNDYLDIYIYAVGMKVLEENQMSFICCGIIGTRF